MISTSRLVALGAIATAGSVLALSAGAQSISMSVVTGSPPGHIISDGGVEPWMACVTAALGDEIEFNYFPAGQLVALRELQSGLESGIANAVPIPVGYASDRLPLNNVSMLPGLGTSAQQIIGSYSRLIREDEAIAAEFAEINAVPIWAMGFPPYQIISTGPAMRTLADFSGRVIRSAGGTMTLSIEALGAAPAEVTVADLYVSMERGVVDSTISGLQSVKPYNLQEIMRSVSTNGAFGTFTNVFAINADFWAELPETVQTVMSDCGLAIEQSIAARMDAESGSLAEEFAALGIDVFEFDEAGAAEINGQLAQVLDGWVERLEGRGLPARAVLEHYQAIMAEQ